MPLSPQAVVFDFDGVIVESVEIKSRAFLELFPRRPDLHEAIRAHHEERLGLSRYEKIRWILQHLLLEAPDESRVEALARRFSELVLEATVACPEVRGARSTLEALRRADLPAFVASGTPQAELEAIVARRGLSSRFREVWGSPKTKVAILEDLLERHALRPSELVMVGDGLSDWDAAETVGVPFVLRETPSQRRRFAALDVVRVDDLEPLATILGLGREPDWTRGKETVGD